MKLQLTKQRNDALTRTDVLVLVAIVVLFIILIPPFDNGSKERARRINCVSNLRQIGIGCNIWPPAQDDKFPMAVSVTNGGGMELIATGNVAGLFRVMSNELFTAKLLYCPSDADRFAASNFFTLANSNISYFVNPGVGEPSPNQIMFGDDNLATNGVPVSSGLLKITPVMLVSWTVARHKYCGNITFADGSVAQENNSSMTNLPGIIDFTNRLAIP